MFDGRDLAEASAAVFTATTGATPDGRPLHDQPRGFVLLVYQAIQLRQMEEHKSRLARMTPGLN